MMRRKELCLTSIKELNGHELLALFSDNKKRLPVFSTQELEETREHIWQQNKFTLVRRFYKTIVSIKFKTMKLNIRLETGTVAVDNNVFKQCDVYIAYTENNKEYVEMFLQDLLKRNKFVLTEPDIWERSILLLGHYQTNGSPRYQRDDLKAALVTHLTWQIYLINQGWADFLCKPLERITLRQLRVKIRRLRSCLAFFKPALCYPEVGMWQAELRRQGVELSLLRELDVALMAMEKIKPPLAEGDDLYPENLAKILTEARTVEAKRLKQKNKIEDITFILARLIMWLEGTPVRQEYISYDVERFLQTQIKEWSRNIVALTQKYPDFTDVEKMHKIRIKVKRFRYVMMTLPELNRNTGNMLRRLKKLQDTLGFLHDEYVNKELVEVIVKADGGKMKLEQAVFRGWESAKITEALAVVPDLWEDFCEDLELWQDTI